MQTRTDSLNQMFQIKNTITTPPNDFDLRVEGFNKTVLLSPGWVAGRFLPTCWPFSGNHRNRAGYFLTFCTQHRMLDRVCSLDSFMLKIALCYSHNLQASSTGAMFNASSQAFPFLRIEVSGTSSEDKKTASTLLTLPFWCALQRAIIIENRQNHKRVLCHILRTELPRSYAK